MEALKNGEVFFFLFSQLLPSTHARCSVQQRCARNRKFDRKPEGAGQERCRSGRGFCGFRKTSRSLCNCQGSNSGDIDRGAVE